jgi:glycolate oxidase FAD binding subunit
MAPNEQDISAVLQEQVELAYAAKTPLNICAGNSKAFYGRAATGQTLDVSAHAGIVSYEPTELVLTARAGTPLRDIESALAVHGQMLAFEPGLWQKKHVLHHILDQAQYQYLYLLLTL